ncbi:hypothetical protein [Photobacterium minamisatsumaniensis]|uniref:hypothetical protein n=1 Tax=Photobacterium minamisatsumaniensis TaxID=2910233 RepID=UPI003D0D0B68
MLTHSDDSTTLLDEIDFISSVSGGSFTAAYYGLYGDDIFDHFEDDFLYHDVGGDLLCSDLHSYPVAEAVTASAAVPIVFNPVVLNNYPYCNPNSQLDLTRNSGDPQIQRTIDGLRSYQNKQRRPYIHLVDGGISDNLGLLAIFDVVESSGGNQAFIEKVKTRPRSHLVIISVDASTEPFYGFEQSTKEPSITDTLSAITDTQLHRYNDVTKNVIWRNMQEWVELSKDDDIMTDPYFIHITLKKIPNPTTRFEANSIPTDFTLSDEDVDLLIKEGERQLLDHPLFHQLLGQIK